MSSQAARRLATPATKYFGFDLARNWLPFLSRLGVIIYCKSGKGAHRPHGDILSPTFYQFISSIFLAIFFQKNPKTLRQAFLCVFIFIKLLISCECCLTFFFFSEIIVNIFLFFGLFVSSHF
jgi:hypothetical protein